MDKKKSTEEVELFENTLLIWLDGNIDPNNEECRETIAQLKCVTGLVDTFTDDEKCIEFIKRKNEKETHMIISGAYGKHVVPRIHDMSQVKSIFIFCGNKKYHEQWAKEWLKIRNVYTEIGPICEGLKEVIQNSKPNFIPLQFVSTNSSGMSFASTNELDSSFMYSQILKEVLLSINFEEKHFKEFIDYCRGVFSENDCELANVRTFEVDYRERTPIWWHTYECFLYPMVNRALRTMDIDVITRIGFYICDLHRQIEQVHSEQFSKDHADTLIVYRGQGVSKTDIERMKNAVGGLMSFNNFFSTCEDKKISLQFARHALKNCDLVGILFVITIDPSLSTTPFASTYHLSYFEEEKEFLFSMNTVFRICAVKPLNEDHRLFQVELTLTKDADQELLMLTDHLRKEICQHPNGWYRLGLLLIKMGHFDKAEEIYQTILDETPDEREKGNLFHQLGLIKVGQDKYKEAITYLEKSLSICEKTLPPNHPHLASSYNHTGLVYEKIAEHSKALTCHEKALKIYQKIRSPDHPDLLSTLSNIGLVYNNIGEHSKALCYHEQVLESRQKTLPSKHPDLAMSYNNIGLVYKNLGDSAKALSFYERAIDIGRRSLPSNHPDLQMFQRNFDSMEKT